jgi:hypothetical protein
LIFWLYPPFAQLPFSVTAQNLKDEFSSVGPVAHAEVVAGFDGRSKGFGFITFSRIADAHKAIGAYIWRPCSHVLLCSTSWYRGVPKFWTH